MLKSLSVKAKMLLLSGLMIVGILNLGNNIKPWHAFAGEDAESTNQTTLTSQELARFANGLETQISQFKM